MTCLEAHNPLNFGGGISTPKFRGRPSQNNVKLGISDTPPPKFRGQICHPLDFGGKGLQGVFGGGLSLIGEAFWACDPPDVARMDKT